MTSRSLTDTYVNYVLSLPADREWHKNSELQPGTLESRFGVWYAHPDTIDEIRAIQRGEFEVDEPKTNRGSILDEAKGLVDGDRNQSYGEPIDDFRKVADALNAYGYSGPGGRKMMPRDIPFFQILVKLSRIVQSPTKRDSWVDAAGYAACGGEVADIEGQP